MTGTQKILFGCGIALMIALFIVGGCVATLAYYIAQSVPEVDMAVDLPDLVATDQRVPLTIRLTNKRATEEAGVSRVDIQASLMEGFRFDGVVPTAVDSRRIMGTLSSAFDIRIPPGETREIVFMLRAVQPGAFAGEVIYAEGLRNTRISVQTHISGLPVVDPPAPESGSRVPVGSFPPDASEDSDTGE